MDLTRRQTLTLAGATAAAALPLTAGVATAADAVEAADAPAADAFDVLLARAEEQLTGGAFDTADPDFAAAVKALDTQASAWWKDLDRSAGRKALWADLSPASDPGMFGQSYPRLRTLATAWATPGTSLTGSAEVADALVAALGFLGSTGYNPARGESGNWWFW
ncbi:hypothetical protein ACFRLW_21470, partial [Streptomyces sp. NPDC056728]